MKTLLALLPAVLLAVAGSSASAQPNGRPLSASTPSAGTPSASTPAAAACLPEHAAMGHCTLAPPAPVSAPAPAAACAPEHAAMGHCTPTTPPTPPTPTPAPPVPASACAPEHAAMGHCTLAAPETLVAEPPVAPPPAAALTGPDHAADAVYGTGAMAPSREMLRREHGGMSAQKVLFDRIEARLQDGADGYLVDGQAWSGGDIDKLWLKAELEGEFGHGLDEVEGQALWSHAIGPWFDLQTGLRYDARTGPDRAHLIFGVQGLAPYWWEVDAAVFVSTKGDITARAEAEHDLRITQKLILQPRAELDFSLQDVPELGLGSGLTNAALGARLRYQLTATFAPYLGLEYDRALGEAARFLRAAGEDPGGWNLAVGLRAWF